MPSLIFDSSEVYNALEDKIQNFLNEQVDFLSVRTVSSTRAAGDAIQEVLAENFEKLLGDYTQNYSSGFARRAMADPAFYNKANNYYVVDVKTHRLDTKFNMPNITSVHRLAKFYQNVSNYFAVLNVDYEVDGLRIVVRKVTFVPIEFLSWSCLTIGALGWGQIQISDSNKITILHGYSRKLWMLEMCQALDRFYPNEISKIEQRLRHFQTVKEDWENRPDDGGPVTVEEVPQ